MPDLPGSAGTLAVPVSAAIGCGGGGSPASGAGAPSDDGGSPVEAGAYPPDAAGVDGAASCGPSIPQLPWIDVGGGASSDDFAANDVHLYRIDLSAVTCE